MQQNFQFNPVFKLSFSGQKRNIERFLFQDVLIVIYFKIHFSQFLLVLSGGYKQKNTKIYSQEHINKIFMVADDISAVLGWLMCRILCVLGIRNVCLSVFVY